MTHPIHEFCLRTALEIRFFVCNLQTFSFSVFLLMELWNILEQNNCTDHSTCLLSLTFINHLLWHQDSLLPPASASITLLYLIFHSHLLFACFKTFDQLCRIFCDTIIFSRLFCHEPLIGLTIRIIRTWKFYVWNLPVFPVLPKYLF